MPFLTRLRKLHGISERLLSQATGVARETIRSCELHPERAKPETLDRVARQLQHQALLLIVPLSQPTSELSSVSTSLAICRDGYASWKIHFMTLIDNFRCNPDIRLVLLPPVSQLDVRLCSLLAAIVQTLCAETQLQCPDWATHEMFLEKPWFVSEVESLKASALVESPLPFRRNNIFVLANFMQRA